ncbi:cobaltochelatase subunit CobN [Aliishimia ponticola]|uniref:Cobaltochelatase subunit CobN n=1 Tax=Aliishimia ponticola TaxID=2499833 RepID=A0A4S4NHN4_9RHOB|nr:cobaltochelatase subunit CobN [Aliishimia ponticola]THH38187.1 cobaltochelatase subunit CobN [Aliishimia ponticola]
MHVIFRESHGLEETDTPMDLGQSPADLVVLSFSDSDLGAFAKAWHRAGGPDGGLPSLRLANLVALRHPLSVDTYIEQTLCGAKGILIRLIGGVPYWAYGLQQVAALARREGIALAVLPADGRPDPRLDEVSTLPVSTLRRLSHLADTGGEVAAQAALAQLALAAGLYAGPVPGSKSLPPTGAWSPARGVYDPADIPAKTRPRIVVTFYRSYLVAADTAPIEALLTAFEARGYEAVALYAPTLKAPEAAAWLRRQITHLDPDAIVNATAFSGKGEDGRSPLDAGGVPVFQVALSTARRKDWALSERGLAPSDLAMHVVLPEVDGRILGGVVSFKEPGKRDPHLEYSRFGHRAEPERIEAVAARVDGWLRLAERPAAQRRPALILSTYPGKDWNLGHAVGLDAPASARAILSDLAGAGYDVTQAPGDLSAALLARSVAWSLEDYAAALAKLPERLAQDLAQTWGAPEDDPNVTDGAFRFAALRCGKAWVALQPERGGAAHLREDEYHDLSRTPRHSYVAFYLWLQNQADALVHIGAHGTLEWLPGKSVALSAECWPDALIGALPVIYPFIVNDPGEAAQAKRRIGAVTLGHIPPPLRQSRTPDRLARLEALLDEFSNADGLDPRRRDRLQRDIREEAQALGLEDDLGLDRAECPAEAVTRIDRFVCDVKESQFGEGLHVWGRPARPGAPFDTDASVAAERQALLDALAGHRVAAGPSGSPYRGRSDVLPTGRNMYTTDPRSVPSRAACAQGVKLADELVRRHLQDEGDWPRGLIVDLWGSATMRTAGEEFAMALHLLGVRPVWDAGSERVSGIEVLPITELDRPRIDVTLRVSGLFRDVFPTLSALFSQAVRALCARDEAPDWNPFAGRADAQNARVYGPAPGSFGLGMGPMLEDYSDASRRAAGEAWLAASSWALDGDNAVQDVAGIRQRVAQADSFVHLQDLPETDVLLASDYAAHEAGFAAAKAIQGGQGGHAALWHVDNTNPDAPRARSLQEEIARVVQARAANPDWISGMRAHGFRGAAEIAATLDHMAAFAHLAGVVGPHLFDLYHEATLGDDDTRAFLERENPEAYRAMCDRFAALLEAGLWQTRRNSIRAALEART